jgi:tetratricopeptide (TPR) repeat protein
MRSIVYTAAALMLAGCAALHPHRHQNPYEKPLFYQRYLNPSDPFDQRIQRTIDALRANPNSAALHNELGQLLVAKGFPKDAEKEFDRAIAADHKFYPAYYNRAQVRAAAGDYAGARRDFESTLRYKPGHAEALFQMGLMEEKRQNDSRAIDLYAKAFTINHNLLDVHVNPRILDSKLVSYALLKAYPSAHDREALQFVGTPATYNVNKQPQAPSPQATAQQIVPLAPSVTDPGTQRPVPTPPPAPKKP